MRTVERFAWIFGIANLILGAASLFSPFVAQRKPRGITRVLPRRKNRGLINTQPGRLFGGLAAVNPPHSVIHSTLGAAGLATRRFNGFSRAYMWITGILFAAMAVMGWSSTGLKPGIHKVMGIATDVRGNILHTLWGAAALLLAAKPDLGQNAAEREFNRTMSEIGV